MQKSAGWLVMSLFVLGCGYETADVSEETGEDAVGAADDAILAWNAISPNAISPNAISPNAISPNAISPNALDPGALDPASMEALQDPGYAGDLSRMHVKYLVRCAFSGSQFFSFSWTDAEDVQHDETYFGLIGLAPDWAYRGIDTTEQAWVSACMGSLTNYYEVSVLVSLRGGHAALSVTQGEIDDYPAREGAFWGNIFEETPHLTACYDAADVDHSRSMDRVCATGLVDSSECGIIDVAGDCASLCTAPQGAGQYYPLCNGQIPVITTYLQN